MLPFLLSLLRRGVRFAALGLAAVSLVAFGVVGLGPHTGRYRTLTVLSGSMRPTMPEGSVAIVIPVPPAEIRPGDVIAYNIPVEDRRVVSHRVVEIVERGDHPVVRTQGDANHTPDPWLARLETEPAWRVWAVVPGLGHVIHALRVWPLRVLLVWGLPALSLALWLTDIGRRRRHCDDEAVLRFATPDPGVVLVVPATWRASRALQNRPQAGISRNLDSDPDPFAVAVTNRQR